MALWMTQGKVNLTANSKNVVGVGTAFLSAAVPARPGQPIVVNGVIMEIATVNSDTSMTLALNYTGATATNLSYMILTTMEGSYNDLARRAAQVMGYYQGYLDVFSALFAGTGNVTVTLPDGSQKTLPSWAELSKIENISAGTMKGPMALAAMKGALKVGTGASTSFQDSTNTVFHHLAVANVFRIASGATAATPLFDVAATSAISYNPIYAKDAFISRNGAQTTWLAMETPASGDPYISSKSTTESSNTVSIRFNGSDITVEKRTWFNKQVIGANPTARTWSSYGTADFRSADMNGASGNLHAALSYPFKITGVYALDLFLGSYAANNNASDVQHVLGFTDGASYNPSWWLSAGGYLRYLSGNQNVGTINSVSPMTGPSFTPTSDARLKPENLREDLGKVSEFLRKLEPKYFFKKYAIDSEQGFYEFGFVADDVEKHESRLVFRTNDEHRLKHLAINGITTHLVKGWQEHDERLGAVEELLKDIDKRLKAAGI